MKILQIQLLQRFRSHRTCSDISSQSKLTPRQASVYGVDPMEWNEIQSILDRRRERRGTSATRSGSPLYINNLIQNGGDPETEEYTYEWEEESNPEANNPQIEIESPDFRECDRRQAS